MEWHHILTTQGQGRDKCSMKPSGHHSVLWVTLHAHHTPCKQVALIPHVGYDHNTLPDTMLTHLNEGKKSQMSLQFNLVEGNLPCISQKKNIC